MEEWKAIPRYEGIYEASNQGRIRSALGKTTFTERHGIRHWKQRILKQKFIENCKGRTDARIILWKDGVASSYLVSRLIALTWCDGYEKNKTVNHIDGNPLNNAADNLEWISRKENIQKGFQDGLYASFQRKTVLVDENGKEFCFRSMAEASRFLGRSNGYVSSAIKNKTRIVNESGNSVFTAYAS